MIPKNKILVGFLALAFCPGLSLAQTMSQSKQFTQVYLEFNKLYGAGELAKAQSLLTGYIKGGYSEPGKSVACVYLYQVLLDQNKKQEAQVLRKRIEQATSKAEQPFIKGALTEVDVVSDIKNRFRPHGLTTVEGFFSQDTQYAWLSQIYAGESADVKRAAWSALNAPPLLIEGGNIAYIFPLMDLIAIEGRAGHKQLVVQLASELTRLLEIPATTLNAKRQVEWFNDELDFWLDRFGIKKAKPLKGYAPGPDALFPSATTPAARRLAGLGPSADKALADYLALCKKTGADECLVVSKGQIVLEWYSDRFKGIPIDICSSTKSITGLIAGIAQGDGKLNPDANVNKYLKSWTGPLRDKVTVQDLLDMTSGLPNDGENIDTSASMIGNWDQITMSLSPIRERGQWGYSSLTVQLMNPILEKVLGTQVSKFARKRLFDPLGIPADSGFEVDSQGITTLARGGSFRAREMARIGALILNKGSWKGKQLIPADWLETMCYNTSSGYGNFFYIENEQRCWPQQLPTHWVQTKGAAFNNMTVFPDLDTVVVRLQQHYWSWADPDYDIKEPAALRALAHGLDASFREVPATQSSSKIKLAISAWPKINGNAANTGRGVGAVNTGTQLWKFNTGKELYSSPAIGQDGTVYLGSSDNNVYAVDGKTGLKKWSFDTKNVVWSTPALAADGTLYVCGGDRKLHSLNSSSGLPNWEFMTGGPLFSSPAIGTGTVYFGSGDHNFYAVDATTGKRKWLYETGGEINSSPAIGPDGTVYQGSSDHNMYAFDPVTGVPKWIFKTGGVIMSSPAVGANGLVYFGSNDHMLYALDAKTGHKKWEYKSGGNIYSDPCIGTDGSVYFGSSDHRAYALDGDTGKVKWSFETGDFVNGTMAIGTGNVLYFGSHDKTFYALDAASGMKKWDFKTISPSHSPALGADGTLYLPCSDHNLYAFH